MGFCVKHLGFFVVVVVFQTIGATFAAMIGAGMLVQSIPYDQSPGPKHLAWMLHSGMFCFKFLLNFLEYYLHSRYLFVLFCLVFETGS